MSETDKSAFRKTIEARLAELDAKVEELKVKGEAASESVRAGYEEKMAAFVAQRDALLQHMKQLRDAGEGAIGEMRSGVERAWVDLVAAFGKARAHFVKDD